MRGLLLCWAWPKVQLKALLNRAGGQEIPAVESEGLAGPSKPTCVRTRGGVAAFACLGAGGARRTRGQRP